MVVDVENRLPQRNVFESLSLGHRAEGECLEESDKIPIRKTDHFGALFKPEAVWLRMISISSSPVNDLMNRAGILCPQILFDKIER